MRFRAIRSRRGVKWRPSWHLVFEWEDELSRSLGIPVIAPSRAGWLLRRLGRRLAPGVMKGGSDPVLEFVMIASPENDGKYGPDAVPWIIDYFLSDVEGRDFLRATSCCPAVLVSSREVYERLLSLGADPSRVIHAPLSLPDIYRPDPSSAPRKDIDLAVIGRVSTVMMDYVRRLMRERPALKVAVSGPRRGGHHWAYDSEGKPLADVESRADYLALLRRSRAFIYSSPGMEDGKPTGGFSQVTPRLLEAMAMGCVPVMRYPDNADTRYYRLPSLAPSVESYDDFVRQIDDALAGKTTPESLYRYLEPHYTSSVAKIINLL